ncbi:MAG: hypothetical protein KAV00_16570, partial [Phycisphaerae bacterium]|nr:hypothetical protein [Phycisphaerae bacterium]
NWTGEAAIRAIEAGNDMVLLPLYVDQTIDAIEAAVNNGRLSHERIVQSVERILKAKTELDLYAERGRLSSESLKKQVGLVESQELSKRMAREAITLVKDEPNLVPLKPGRRETLTHILFSMDDDLKERTRPFWQQVARTFSVKRTTNIFINEKLSSTRIKEVVAAARKSDHVIVTALVRIHMDKGASTIDASHHKLLTALSKAGVKYILASFGSPYLPSLKPVPTYLAGYGYWAGGMEAMSEAIFGAAPITGRLPVNLDKKYLRGHGITRELSQSPFRAPDRPVDFRQAYAVLDSAINERITPGAQVFVAQGGAALADAAFGYATYEPGANRVTSESIYDLA